VKDEFKERLENLEIQLDMLEKQITFNELDMHTSKAEISNRDVTCFMNRCNISNSPIFGIISTG
jgi:hypothetical protein